jgi:hypothetical protein
MKIQDWRWHFADDQVLNEPNVPSSECWHDALGDQPGFEASSYQAPALLTECWGFFSALYWGSNPSKLITN